MARIADLLFEQSVYDNVPPDDIAIDFQGWNYLHPIFLQVIQELKPKLILEIGSWKGCSAITMARSCRGLGLDCEIVCIDTWLGAPEFWLARGTADPQKSGWYHSLGLKHGHPSLYQTFLGNVISFGVTDYITPFPQTSTNAAEILKTLGVQADFIYVDGAHDYRSVIHDLEDYWDLLSPDGVILGDDYIAQEPVTRAAHEFARAKNRPLFGTTPKYLIPKSDRWGQAFSATLPPVTL